MKNLILTGLIMLAVIFGCNMNPPADYVFQGWKPSGLDGFRTEEGKVSIISQSGFFNESGRQLKKDFCIGTNFEKPAKTVLEGVAIESGGNSYPGTWENNTTLDGSSSYSKKECGHINVIWNFDKAQSEIYRQGATMTFSLKIDDKPEQVKVQIVPRNDYKVEPSSENTR
jgi:hypothetical protein